MDFNFSFKCACGIAQQDFYVKHAQISNRIKQMGIVDITYNDLI